MKMCVPNAFENRRDPPYTLKMWLNPTRGFSSAHPYNLGIVPFDARANSTMPYSRAAEVIWKYLASYGVYKRYQIISAMLPHARLLQRAISFVKSRVALKVAKGDGSELKVLNEPALGNNTFANANVDTLFHRQYTVNKRELLVICSH